jgi:hypothetical protein
MLYVQFVVDKILVVALAKHQSTDTPTIKLFCLTLNEVNAKALL